MRFGRPVPMFIFRHLPDIAPQHQIWYSDWWRRARAMLFSTVLSLVVKLLSRLIQSNLLNFAIKVILGLSIPRYEPSNLGNHNILSKRNVHQSIPSIYHIIVLNIKKYHFFPDFWYMKYFFVFFSLCSLILINLLVNDSSTISTISNFRLDFFNLN